MYNKLINITIEINHGERKVYHNDYEAYEDRNIVATVRSTCEIDIFDKKFRPYHESKVSLPKHLEDKLTAIWHEVEAELSK